MRLLFYISSMRGGGAERVMALLTSEMVRRGHDVSLATNCRYPFAYSLDPSIRIHPLYPSLPSGNRIIRTKNLYREIRRIAKRSQADIIVSFLPNVCAAVWGLGIPVIQSEHTALNRKLPLKQEFGRKIVNKFASAVTVLTPTDLRLIRRTVPHAVIMPNPLTFPLYDTPASPREKTVLAVGRLFAWEIKGFDLLLESWGKIADRYPEWKLQIAGDGRPEDFSRMRSLIRYYQIENSVELLGFRKDIDLLLQKASLFVLSSRYEGFSMVLIEAMSQGCPCISFDCDNGPRFILKHEESGILVEKENSLALSQAIADLIEHPAQRQALARQAMKEVAQYSIDKIADRWEKLFDKIQRKT